MVGWEEAPQAGIQMRPDRLDCLRMHFAAIFFMKIVQYAQRYVGSGSFHPNPRLDKSDKQNQSHFDIDHVHECKNINGYDQHRTKTESPPLPLTTYIALNNIQLF